MALFAFLFRSVFECLGNRGYRRDDFDFNGVDSVTNDLLNTAQAAGTEPVEFFYHGHWCQFDVAKLTYKVEKLKASRELIMQALPSSQFPLAKFASPSAVPDSSTTPLAATPGQDEGKEGKEGEEVKGDEKEDEGEGNVLLWKYYDENRKGWVLFSPEDTKLLESRWAGSKIRALVSGGDPMKEVCGASRRRRTLCRSSTAFATLIYLQVFLRGHMHFEDRYAAAIPMVYGRRHLHLCGCALQDHWHDRAGAEGDFGQQTPSYF